MTPNEETGVSLPSGAVDANWPFKMGSPPSTDIPEPAPGKIKGKVKAPGSAIDAHAVDLQVKLENAKLGDKFELPLKIDGTVQKNAQVYCTEVTGADGLGHGSVKGFAVFSHGIEIMNVTAERSEDGIWKAGE
jgi:hypothetical protein